MSLNWVYERSTNVCKTIKKHLLLIYQHFVSHKRTNILRWAKNAKVQYGQMTENLGITHVICFDPNISFKRQLSKL